jgi:hypothetical protein
VVIFRIITWEGHEARMGETRSAHRVLWESVKERKRLLGRPKCTREDNSDVGCARMGWLSEDWFNLAWDRGK